MLEDPFDSKLLDVIIFDALPHMDITGEGLVALAKEIKERNPLHFGFQVLFHLKIKFVKSAIFVAYII